MFLSLSWWEFFEDCEWSYSASFSDVRVIMFKLFDPQIILELVKRQE